MGLWAAAQYSEASNDVAWLNKATFNGSSYDAMEQGIANAIEGQIESNGIMGQDSGIWEVHDAKKRHWAFTTLAAARGLCDFAAIAKKAGKGDPTKWANLSKRIGDAFAATFVDDKGALAGSLEGLGNARYTDGAVAEAFDWNILKDWQGATAKATLLQLGKLRVASGGYKRNDNTDSDPYDNNEWILVDLRIANALRRAGRGAEGDGIIAAQVVQKAAANFYLVPELYQAVSGKIGSYTGSIPMVGYGGGAYVITMMDRSGLIEPNDCGDGKGVTLPKVDCGGISTNPGTSSGAAGDGGTSGGANGGVPDANEVPFVAACLCNLHGDRGLSPLALGFFVSIPALLLARRGRSRSAEGGRAPRSGARNP